MCDCDIAFQTVATPWQKIPPIFWPRLIGQDTHFSSMSEKWDMSSSLPACLYAPLGRRKFSFAPLNTHDQCLVTFPEKTCGGLMNFWLEEKVLSPTCMTDHLLKLCRQERWWILHKEKNSPSSAFPFLLGSPSIQGNFRFFQTGCFMCALPVLLQNEQWTGNLVQKKVSKGINLRSTSV